MATLTSRRDGPTAAETIPLELRGTNADQTAMDAMNRKQQLRRTFRVTAMAAFVSSVMVSWPMFWNVIYWPLTDGGRPAMFAAMFWSLLVWIPTYASIVELAQM